MSIYITGDLHGLAGLKRLNTFFDAIPDLTKSDYLIITGDFGLVWNGSNEEELALDQLNQMPFTTLFVDGNHENFDRLKMHPIEQWQGGKVHPIRDSIFHLMRGQVFNLSETTFFTMGGAASIDRIFRIENVSWWQEEIPSNEELNEGLINLARHQNAVDYIITHTCSQEVHETLEKYMPLIELSDPVCKYLQGIEDNIRFKHWYFGHFHLDAPDLCEKHSALHRQVLKIL